MSGVNKAIIVGNLGKDPEVRYMADGKAVASITIATSDKWKDKQTGEQKERTEWHNVTFFGRLAEVVGQYLNKGSQVYVEGKIQTDKWQDKEGNDRYTTKIIAHEMQMLGSRGGQQSEKPHNKPGESVPAHEYESVGDDFDSDVPFFRLSHVYCF